MQILRSPARDVTLGPLSGIEQGSCMKQRQIISMQNHGQVIGLQARIFKAVKERGKMKAEQQGETVTSDHGHRWMNSTCHDGHYWMLWLGYRCSMGIDEWSATQGSVLWPSVLWLGAQSTSPMAITECCDLDTDVASMNEVLPRD
jgi:hypothetical protein